MGKHPWLSAPFSLRLPLHSPWRLHRHGSHGFLDGSQRIQQRMWFLSWYQSSVVLRLWCEDEEGDGRNGKQEECRDGVEYELLHVLILA